MCDWKLLWSKDSGIINNNIEVSSGDCAELIFLRWVYNKKLTCATSIIVENHGGTLMSASGCSEQGSVTSKIFRVKII